MVASVSDWRRFNGGGSCCSQMDMRLFEKRSTVLSSELLAVLLSSNYWRLRSLVGIGHVMLSSGSHIVRGREEQ